MSKNLFKNSLEYILVANLLRCGIKNIFQNQPEIHIPLSTFSSHMKIVLWVGDTQYFFDTENQHQKDPATIKVE